MNLSLVARSIFLETLEQVRISDVICSWVQYEDGLLRIGEMVYSMLKFHRVMLVAIGKAAVPMCEALLPILESALASGQILEGVIVGIATYERRKNRDVIQLGRRLARIYLFAIRKSALNPQTQFPTLDD